MHELKLLYIYTVLVVSIIQEENFQENETNAKYSDPVARNLGKNYHWVVKCWIGS